MSNFKVICKANNSNSWETVPRPTKVIHMKRLLGLIKRSIVVDDPQYNGGPSKDEICIVYETYQNNNCSFYLLKGYGNMGYDTKWFIKLDELEETQKEIAQKSQPVFN